MLIQPVLGEISKADLSRSSFYNKKKMLQI